MNALAEMPHRARPHTVAPVDDIRLPTPKGGYAIGLVVALGIHAAILFGWHRSQAVDEQVEFGVEAADSSVEVSLVAALPAEESVEAVEPPPEPEVVPPPPEPEPDPVVTPEPPPVVDKPPEMTIPEPAPTPKPQRVEPPKPKPSKAAPKPPVRLARVSGDGSAAIPGRDATTATAASGAISSKPGYLRNPHPAYPEEARKARQEGVVHLQVSVDEEGSATLVRIARSSGYPLLDERAHRTVSEQWRFKPARAAGVAVSSQVVIPIRFTLH